MKITRKISKKSIYLCLMLAISGVTNADVNSVSGVNGICEPGEDVHFITPPENTLKYVVMIHVNNSSGKPVDWGTGTFITPNKILTAAHVVVAMQNYKNSGRDVYVTAGINEPESGTRYDISDMVANPDFNPDLYTHDVGIITTHQNYTGDRYPFAEFGDGIPDYLFGGVSYPSDLIHEENAFNQYGARFRFEKQSITNHIITTQCRSYAGESGSPLFGYDLNNPYNGIIVGVLSHGTDPDAGKIVTAYDLLIGSDYQFVIDNL